MNQENTGRAIERFINRGNTPTDPVMKQAGTEILQVRKYFSETISPNLIKSLFGYINIPQDKSSKLLDKPDVTLSIIHYPSRPIDMMRIPAHQDGVLVTILWAPEAGLEAYINNQWEQITCPPGYAIAQIGDGLKLLSNEKLQPLRHRVRVNKNTKRNSVASFFGLNHTRPFYNLITDELIANNFGEYINAHIKQTYDANNLTED